jgi:hypothetical protein
MGGITGAVVVFFFLLSKYCTLNTYLYLKMSAVGSSVWIVQTSSWCDVCFRKIRYEFSWVPLSESRNRTVNFLDSTTACDHFWSVRLTGGAGDYSVGFRGLRYSHCTSVTRIYPSAQIRRQFVVRFLPCLKCAEWSRKLRPANVPP